MPSASIVRVLAISPTVGSAVPSFVLFMQVSKPFMSGEVTRVLPIVFRTSQVLAVQTPYSSGSPYRGFGQTAFVPTLVGLADISASSLTNPVMRAVFIFFVRGGRLVLCFMGHGWAFH